MCTVTFVPFKGGCFLTSNRDERLTRPVATCPAMHKMSTGSILFPRDPQAGGTWFAVHQNGSVGIILNGGMVKHRQLDHYKRSRGLVLLDILDSMDPLEIVTSKQFKDVEPFTVVLWAAERLYELVWTGVEKIIRQLSTNTPHVWSSSTLYSGEIADTRKRWFMDWLTANPKPIQQDIINFHLSGGDGDPANALLMSREEIYRTVSITSAAIAPKEIKLHYFDCLSEITTVNTVIPQNEIMQH